jgi:hypothetical protein
MPQISAFLEAYRGAGKLARENLKVVTPKLSTLSLAALLLECNQGILKGESITVPLISCYTGLESAV